MMQTIKLKMTITINKYSKMKNTTGEFNTRPIYEKKGVKIYGKQKGLL